MLPKPWSYGCVWRLSQAFWCPYVKLTHTVQKVRSITINSTVQCICPEREKKKARPTSSFISLCFSSCKVAGSGRHNDNAHKHWMCYQRYDWERIQCSSLVIKTNGISLLVGEKEKVTQYEPRYAMFQNTKSPLQTNEYTSPWPLVFFTCSELVNLM